MSNEILTVKENIENFGIKMDVGKTFIEIYFIRPNKKCDIFVNRDQAYDFIEIWEGVDIKYKKSRRSLKETIIIKNIQSVHTLKFLIKNKP